MYKSDEAKFKQIMPGQIIILTPEEFIGNSPIRTELAVMPHDPSVKGWVVKEHISVDGNKYLRLLKKYLKRKNKTSEDELSREEIEKLYSKCEIR